ncbi:hypothetical protein ACVXG7_14950 [Enterobacter hormaechei]
MIAEGNGSTPDRAARCLALGRTRLSSAGDHRPQRTRNGLWRQLARKAPMNMII